jgi:hypothetical protein
MKNCELRLYLSGQIGLRRRLLFSDVEEWWDEGKAEIKHIIIEYSKAVRQQINE